MPRPGLSQSPPEVLLANVRHFLGRVGPPERGAEGDAGPLGARLRKPPDHLSGMSAVRCDPHNQSNHVKVATARRNPAGESHPQAYGAPRLLAVITPYSPIGLSVS